MKEFWKILQNFPNGIKKIIMRFPFIKGVNDDEKNIHETAKFLKKLNLLEVNILPLSYNGT